MYNPAGFLSEFSIQDYSTMDEADRHLIVRINKLLNWAMYIVRVCTQVTSNEFACEYIHIKSLPLSFSLYLSLSHALTHIH